MQEPKSNASRNSPLWPDGLTIRARSPADATSITDLHNLPGYRWGTMRLPYHAVEEIRRAIEQQASEVTGLVALLEGMVVGEAALMPAKGRRAHVGAIGMGVHDNFTRRGIGRALLGELVTVADDWLNLKRLELTVYADNDAAIGLYEQFGFITEGRMSDYAYRAGRYVDALAMARLRS